MVLLGPIIKLPASIPSIVPEVMEHSVAVRVKFPDLVKLQELAASTGAMLPKNKKPSSKKLPATSGPLSLIDLSREKAIFMFIFLLNYLTNKVPVLSLLST